MPRKPVGFRSSASSQRHPFQAPSVLQAMRLRMRYRRRRFVRTIFTAIIVFGFVGVTYAHFRLHWKLPNPGLDAIATQQLSELRLPSSTSSVAANAPPSEQEPKGAASLIQKEQEKTALKNVPHPDKVKQLIEGKREANAGKVLMYNDPQKALHNLIYGKIETTTKSPDEDYEYEEEEDETDKDDKDDKDDEMTDKEYEELLKEYDSLKLSLNLTKGEELKDDEDYKEEEGEDEEEDEDYEEEEGEDEKKDVKAVGDVGKQNNVKPPKPKKTVTSTTTSTTTKPTIFTTTTTTTVKPPSLQSISNAPVACDNDCQLFRQRLQTWPAGKPKAVIYYLLYKKSFKLLPRSVGSLDRYFRRKFNYPIIFFIEPDIDNEQNRKKLYAVSKGLDDHNEPMPIYIQVVRFSIPPYVNASAVPKMAGFGRRKRSIGYRHMCRFHAGGVYQQPIMLSEGLEYGWRLDDDSVFASQVGYDLFQFMRDRKLEYGYRQINTGWSPVDKDLWLAVDRYVNATNGALRTPFYESWPKNKARFFNNFEISALSVWKSKQYQDYFDFVDHLGGIYYYKWGDAAIKTIAVTIFIPSERTHNFNELEYLHV